MGRDYDRELQHIADAVSKTEGVSVEKGLVEFEKPLGRLGKLCMLYRYLVERGDANQAPKAIRILYAKVANCLMGVLRLLEAGNAASAAMVLRSLFEAAVHLQVVLKEDTAYRCHLFENYVFVERMRLARENHITAEKKLKNAEDLARVRDDYHPLHPNSWCWKAVPSARLKKGIPDNPSLKELCEHIGHPEYYDDVYGHLSGTIHPVPSYEMWMRRPDGKIEFGPNFGPQIYVEANLATALGADCLVKTIQFLSFPDELELCGLVMQEMASSG